MSGKEWWRPEVFAGRRDNLRIRSQVLTAVRTFFAARDFAEVETPCLQVSPGQEPHLKAFATALEDAWGGPDRPLYLHTSPEFAMKKLLVAGVPRLYQLARVFRNAERSPTHHPEFTMLEWYRAGGTIDDLMGDTETLVRDCARAAGMDRLRRLGTECDPFAPWRRLSVAEAFAEYAGIDILATAPDSWSPDRAALAAEALRIGLSVSAADSWEDIFFKVMMDRIEPHLGYGVPVFLHSYPVSMAALSRPSPTDSRVAERFEAYGCGVELCNAFGELTDAAEQRRRFTADMDLKEALYGQRYPLDEDFLTALDTGMPESAGIALGFDRLVMLLAGAESIDEVLWAPVA
ncbi:MAG: EF-P lysine aminoacylase GenX [Magnetospirillum sp.]|nr:EF-P lysine aminoacylase GenX [Magnetospirillum sp.]